MHKYRVGQMVELLPLNYYTSSWKRAQCGRITTITGFNGVRNGIPSYWIDITTPQGEQMFASERRIRPINDKPPASDWATFEKLCGFNPSKTLEYVK